MFFSPAFFGYEKRIEKKMKELGASVDFYDERSVTSSFQRALLKVNPSIFNKRTEQYYMDIFRKHRSVDYDYIIFVKCDMPTEKVLKACREFFKNSKICLHLWDSVKNIPNITSKFQFFDCCTSFDKNDCQNYDALHFRPLFYCDEYIAPEYKGTGYDYDLCFIGTIHSDRYKILKELVRQGNELGMKIYMYPFLQSKFIYYFYKLTKPEFRGTAVSDFCFDKKSSQEISQIVDRSRCVIDIQHPGQTGLTIRTIEMVGMKKKLITTNDPRNIGIVDREKPVIDFDFKSDYTPLDEKIYRKYSLESWIYEVLGI